VLARSSAVDCTTFEPHTSLFPLVSKACYYSPVRSHVMCQLCVNQVSRSALTLTHLPRVSGPTQTQRIQPLNRVNTDRCPIKIKFQCVRRISAASGAYVLKSHSIAYLESAVPAWHHEQEAACMTSSLLVTTAPAAKTRRTQRCPCLETLQQLHASLCMAREVRPTPCGSRHIPTWASPSRVCLGPPAQLPESHQPYTTSYSLRLPLKRLPSRPGAHSACRCWVSRSSRAVSASSACDCANCSTQPTTKLPMNSSSTADQGVGTSDRA